MLLIILYINVNLELKRRRCSVARSSWCLYTQSVFVQICSSPSIDVNTNLGLFHFLFSCFSSPFYSVTPACCSDVHLVDEMWRHNCGLRVISYNHMLDRVWRWLFILNYWYPSICHLLSRRSLNKTLIWIANSASRTCRSTTQTGTRDTFQLHFRAHAYTKCKCLNIMDTLGWFWSQIPSGWLFRI